MNIRRATTADLEVIAAYNVALALESEGLNLDLRIVRAGVQAVLDDAGRGMYFVAEIDGGVAGQTMITYEWSDWRNGTIWWLQSVYVAERFRRRGVFRALFEHVAASARAATDVCALRLYMERHNRAAQAAYEKLGMTLGEYVVLERNVERP